MILIGGFELLNPLLFVLDELILDTKVGIRGFQSQSLLLQIHFEFFLHLHGFFFGPFFGFGNDLILALLSFLNHKVALLHNIRTLFAWDQKANDDKANISEGHAYGGDQRDF
jgi:hypothetical protein